jgi:predicted nucleic acid-binding protein
MARELVPDTTVFVAAIRQSDRMFLEAVYRGNIWLSAVVACELYSGTRSGAEAVQLDRMVRGAKRANRLLVPTLEDWTRAGRLLARRVRLHGSLRPRDHLADVLIVASAGRIGGEVLTSNRVHFEIWADLARRSGLDVIVRHEPSNGSLSL